MPHSQPVTLHLMQCPSVIMQQLRTACRQAIRQLQPQLFTNEAAIASRTSSKRSCKLPQSHGTWQQQSGSGVADLQQPQQHCQQQLQQLRSWHSRTAAENGSRLQQCVTQPMRLLQRNTHLSPGNCSNRLQLLHNNARHIVVQHHSSSFRHCTGQLKPFCRCYSSSSSSSSSMVIRQQGFAATAARRLGTSSSSSWRSWLAQQGSSSSSSSSSIIPWQLLHSRSAATGLTAYCTGAGNAAAAANLAAALRTAAANSSSALSARAAAIAGWCDSWALWVDRTSGFLLSSMLNALNLVGNKLPMALGLLLVDMAHNSPLLGGSRADSLQQPYLPAHLPQGGFYADGGLAAAGAEVKQRSHSDQRSLISLVQAFWSETAAAASAGARLIWLGFIWLPAVVTSPVALYWDFGRSWWLVLLRLSLEFSGPAFIKWGQWAATRHDLFAQDVCNALEQLHTNAPAHSFRFTCSQLKKSFSLPPKELFVWIEESPIACGSIGQVHRARLSDKGAALTGCASGDLVAIKVRHPGVDEAIERDFQTMVWLAQLAGQLLPAARSLRLDDTLKQFAAPLHEQVDLSREAANLQKFNKNFKRTRAVSFPLPLYPLVSPDVLVESFEAGRHISHYIAAAEGSNPYRSRLAELGSGTMLQMMLVDNLIHSDLHPGNILVRLEPPGGLLGLAYKTLCSLANPDGSAMKLLARTLDRMHARQDARSDQITGSRDHSDLAAPIQNPGLDDQQALTVSVARSDITSGTSPRLRIWADLQQLLSNARAAAADPAAFLSKVQGALSEITAGWLQPHIVLLDVGMATELTPEDQTNMIGLFRAFAALNGAEVANWVLRFSGSDQSCPAPQSFVEDMQVTFEALKKTIAAHAAAEARWKQQQQQRRQQQRQASTTSNSSSSSSTTDNALEGNGTGLVPMPEKFDSGAEALATVLELVRVHGVSLPGHICAVVVTTLILEGWSNKLAPEHSVLNQVKGMFSPAMYSWHDRMDSVVDLVMDRGDTALLLT